MTLPIITREILAILNDEGPRSPAKQARLEDLKIRLHLCMAISLREIAR